MGCKGLDYDGEPPLKLWRTLRKHLQQNGVVVLLGDFYRPSFPKAYLFGKETRSPAGTATLFLENETPVIPYYGYRKKGFNHQILIEPPIELGSKERFSTPF